MNAYILGAKKVITDNNLKFHTLGAPVNLISDSENADGYREINFGRTQMIFSLYLDENLICLEVFFRGNFVHSRFFIFEYSDVVSMNGGEFKLFIDQNFNEQINQYDPNSEVEELRMNIDIMTINNQRQEMYNEFTVMIYNRHNNL